MTSAAEIAAVRAALEGANGVIVFTGAGVSAESGVPTFRDRDGIWARFDFEELATPEGFARDPRKVWEWYDLRRRTILECRPNPGHVSLARLLRDRPDATLVTQNVDGLHQRALAEVSSAESEGKADRVRRLGARILELHGSLFRVRCSRCTDRRDHSHSLDAEADLNVEAEAGLPCCKVCGAFLRPDVVWFGEALDSRTLDEAFAVAREAELCLVVGTSAVVYPAAGIPLATLDAGGSLVEVNTEVTPLSHLAQFSLRGLSGEVLPRLMP